MAFRGILVLGYFNFQEIEMHRDDHSHIVLVV
jgi:hypothetical protein